MHAAASMSYNAVICCPRLDIDGTFLVSIIIFINYCDSIDWLVEPK